MRQRNPRFEGDQYLNQLLISSHDISGDDIRVFNYCRLFLKVEMISDILTADGKSVRQDIWKGKQNDAPPLGRDDWPQQPRPTEASWKLWRFLLQRMLDLNSNGKIQHCRPIRIRRTTDWPWVYEGTTERLYQLSSNIIWEYPMKTISMYATQKISITR